MKTNRHDGRNWDLMVDDRREEEEQDEEMEMAKIENGSFTFPDDIAQDFNSD